MDVDGAVYSSLPNETESSMGAVGIQGLSASGLLSQYQQGVETVEGQWGRRCVFSTSMATERVS